MPAPRLKELYDDPDKVVVTAHRGFSGRYPENTLLAFRQAVELDVDIIEFDVRGTRDGVPVVLHDATLDRTSDGAGPVHDYTLDELRAFNFSYWQGGHFDGHRLTEPAFAGVTIPTLREVLDEFKGVVGLNLHVYETAGPLLGEVCRLYDEYELYDDGYLAVNTFREARLVRGINPRIELCVLEGQEGMEPGTLQAYADFGCTFLQPGRDVVTPEFCRAARELGLLANMFYSNTDEDNGRYIGYGLRGILTDYPDVLRRTIERLGMH
jgi:glycerophosphoryl diester phosphodiesterase